MSYFSPVTQRTMFAVVTASAIGSGCYAWMSKTGRTTISDPKTSAAGLATLSQSFGWKRWVDHMPSSMWGQDL